jgi:hypothetical protein
VVLDMAIKKVKFEDIKRLRGRTTKEELDKMTDARIKQAVLSDRDAAMPTARELKEFGKPRKRGHKTE